MKIESKIIEIDVAAYHKFVLQLCSKCAARLQQSKKKKELMSTIFELTF